MGQRVFLTKSRELIVCDHCEFVSQCDLRGPDDSRCPHHYELYTGETEIMTIDIATETNRIIKIKTEEKEMRGEGGSPVVKKKAFFVDRTPWHVLFSNI